LGFLGLFSSKNDFKFNKFFQNASGVCWGVARMSGAQAKLKNGAPLYGNFGK
jgi:hypothetical protein